MVEILADTQQKSGDVYRLKGNVEIRYQETTLTANEVTYDESQRQVEAQGHVVLERGDDRLEAADASYNLRTGAGTLRQVEGTVGVASRPSESVLVSPNPFYFKARQVERRSDGSYLVIDGWVTNCNPGRPKWRLRAARARIRPGDDARLYHATFVLGGVPIFFSPYTWVPIEERLRKSGFLLPSVGSDSVRGTNFGAAYFWAINEQADLTLGGEFFNQGGWTQRAEFRARPSETSRVNIRFFGAQASKLQDTLRTQRGRGVNQTGQEAQATAVAELPSGFRGVIDATHLSSLRFRLGFAETFSEAVDSEVRATAFLSNNPGVYYFNGFFGRYQNFFQADPETSVTFLTLPGAEFGLRPKLIEWVGSLPLYFSFDSSVGGKRRDDPRFDTPELVQRFSLYPRVTMPFRLGRYFGVTPTFGVRASRYSARVIDDPGASGGKRVLNDPIRRVTEEVSVDLSFPSLQRIFERPQYRYKHVIEPEVTYRYVNGVRSFEEFLRFDEEDIVTDTHEVEYSVTQRLFEREREGDASARQLISWRLSQKYYLDPTFRGALTPGARNVFLALNSLTPFAFADGARRFSPITSVVRITPGGRYNTDFRVDYDPLKHKLVNSRLAVETKLTREWRFSVSHYTARNSEVLQPRANQVGLLAGYGQLNRRGFNAAFGTTWDVRRDFLPNAVVQLSYNWDCCGVAFSYRRLGLGPLRSQNEFRFAFTLANIGTFGNITRSERLF